MRIYNILEFIYNHTYINKIIKINKSYCYLLHLPKTSTLLTSIWYLMVGAGMCACDGESNTTSSNQFVMLLLSTCHLGEDVKVSPESVLQTELAYSLLFLLLCQLQIQPPGQSKTKLSGASSVSNQPTSAHKAISLPPIIDTVSQRRPQPSLPTAVLLQR